MASVRSLYRSASIRSSLYSAIVRNRILNGSNFQQQSRTFFIVSSLAPSKRVFSDFRSPFGMSIGRIRTFSQDVAHFPDIKDPAIKRVFKDFIAIDWWELPDALVNDALEVLSKDTDDEVGKESLKNVLRAAEAVEEFSGILDSLKMELDDSVGMSGENVKPLPDYLVSALKTAFDRYTKYLDSFGPDELYLKKKVETELGTRMIYLKMRCGGLGPEWGKASVLATSGLSGSYIEQRGK